MAEAARRQGGGRPLPPPPRGVHQPPRLKAEPVDREKVCIRFHFRESLKHLLGFFLGFFYLHSLISLSLTFESQTCPLLLRVFTKVRFTTLLFLWFYEWYNCKLNHWHTRELAMFVSELDCKLGLIGSFIVDWWSSYSGRLCCERQRTKGWSSNLHMERCHSSRVNWFGMYFTNRMCLSICLVLCH